MIENVIVSAVGILVVLVCAVPILAWLEKRKDAKEEAGTVYGELRIVTAGHKPARDLPITLNNPDIYAVRDVVFDMTEERRPNVLRVEARWMSEREWRDMESRN